MKGVLVFLAVVAVASAGVPALEKGIIEDMLQTIKCLKDLSESVQGQIDTILGSIKNLQNIIDDSINKFNECLNLSNPLDIATCIGTVTEDFQQDVTEAILAVRQAVSAILGLPDSIVACWKL